VIKSAIFVVVVVVVVVVLVDDVLDCGGCGCDPSWLTRGKRV